MKTAFFPYTSSMEKSENLSVLLPDYSKSRFICPRQWNTWFKYCLQDKCLENKSEKALQSHLKKSTKKKLESKHYQKWNFRTKKCTNAQTVASKQFTFTHNSIFTLWFWIVSSRSIEQESSDNSSNAPSCYWFPWPTSRGSLLNTNSVELHSHFLWLVPDSFWYNERSLPVLLKVHHTSK